MSNDSESKTEQQEETIDLFAEGFDDKTLLEDEESPGEQAAEQGATDTDDEDIPEKYRGKSIKDVIDMHLNAEKAMGRTNNELGELRKLTDQILQQQLGEDKAAAQKAKLDSDTLLEDPDAAINSAVEANPRLKQLEAKLTARERADQLAAFNRQHPNAGALVNDPTFLAWVDASPTRKRLLQQADQTFDYELASEILTTYEALHPSNKEEAEQERQESKRAMSNAKPSASSAGKGKKRVYKRADLMRLRTVDPDRYEKLQPEILAAYAEGRVR